MSLAVDALVFAAALPSLNVKEIVKAYDGIALAVTVEPTLAIDVFLGTSPKVTAAAQAAAQTDGVKVVLVSADRKSLVSLEGGNVTLARDDVGKLLQQHKDKIGSIGVVYVLLGEDVVGAGASVTQWSPAVAETIVPGKIAHNTAVSPDPVKDIQGDSRWLNMHDAQRGQVVRQARIELVLVGDSIVNQMAFSSFHKLLQTMDVPLVNLGIGGDQVQHAWWRVNDIGLDVHAGATCKAVVLLVGTNNQSHTARQVAEGMAGLAARLAELLPNAKILVVEVLPRGRVFNCLRVKREQTNRILHGLLKQQPRAVFIQTGSALLDNINAEIPSDLMMDYLHLSDNAYGRLARLLLPQLQAAGLF